MGEEKASALGADRLTFDNIHLLRDHPDAFHDMSWDLGYTRVLTH